MNSRTTAALLLALTALAGLAAFASAETCHTYVVNKSSQDILVTTSYTFAGKSKFIKRKIPANGGKDDDEYTSPYGRCRSVAAQGGAFKVNLEVQVATAKNHNNFNVKPDVSVIALDNPDNGGVDFFETKFGKLEEKTGDLKCTIFNN